MARSIFDLDREIASFRSATRGAPAPKPKSSPMMRTARPVAAKAAARSTRRIGALGLARAFDAIDYMVPEPMPQVGQPSGATCWAAAFAMLYGWKTKNAAITFNDAMTAAGPRWKNKSQEPTKENQGIHSSETADFCADTGLVMLPMNPSIDGITQLLRQNGPLMIWLRLATNTDNWTHARVITGIRGDGTPDGTTLLLMDPDGPQRIERPFRDHLREYEDCARLFPHGTDITMPIFHWPAGARALSLSRGRGSRSNGVARSFGAVDVTITGMVPPLRQPSGNTCWATTYTMMASWRQNQSIVIADAVGAVDPAWADKFRRDEGLSGAEKPKFLEQAGLEAKAPMNPSFEGWAQMLSNYGPIWVTTDEGTGTGHWAIHARVLTGIHGDGTEAGTMLDITDPGTGTAYRESYNTFLAKFEHEAATPGMPLRIQIVHWPPGAQSMSLSHRRWFSPAREWPTGRSPSSNGAYHDGSPRDVLMQALVDAGRSRAEAAALLAGYDNWNGRAHSAAAGLQGFAFGDDEVQGGAEPTATEPAPTARTRVTLEELRRFSPNARDAVITPIEPTMNDVLTACEVTTPLRVAHFFAQIANETGGFRALSENLNYSAERLRQVWPGIFTSDDMAQRYASAGPEAIANKAYGGRLGNGPESSGDGWLFRGRGFMQLTGKANYKRFGDAVGVDLIANPDVAADPIQGFRLATLFWRAVNCNQDADADNIEGVTKRVNGGLIGIEDRRKWLNRAKAVWS